MAWGSQPCRGTRAALTPTPIISKTKIILKTGPWLSRYAEENPVAEKSTGPTIDCSQITATRKTAPPPKA